MVEALIALSAALTAMDHASQVATRLVALITKAQSEGRNVSDVEVQAILTETEALEKSVRERLKSISQK